MQKRGKYLGLKSQDEMFRSLTGNPLILNELPAEDIKDRETINDLVTTTYGSDVTSLDATPRCKCGALNDAFLLGHLCVQCNTRVDHDYTRDLEPSVWISAPDGIEGLFTPIAFELFSRRLRSKSWNGLEWLCNTNYKKPDSTNNKALEILRIIDRLGMQRGLNETIRDYDKLVELCCQLSSKAVSAKYAEDFEEILLANKDKLLTRYLPMPSKVAFVLEKTALGDWTDKPFRHAMEAIRTVNNLEHEQGDLKRIGNRLTAVMTHLNAYYNEVLGDPLCKKEGWFRQTVYGTRMNFTLRSVITSRSDTHHYEEIQIPYTQACVLFKVHLLNRLINLHGFNYRDAYEYIEANQIKVDKFLWDEIMALIQSTPNGEGFWVTITRYPTLSRGSTQAGRITGLTDSAVTMSVLIIKAPNADFDGDNISSALYMCEQDRKAIEYLRPHYSIHRYSSPWRLNKHISFPDNTVGVLSNWIMDEDINY